MEWAKRPWVGTFGRSCYDYGLASVAGRHTAMGQCALGWQVIPHHGVVYMAMKVLQLSILGFCKLQNFGINSVRAILA
jgi:hypothetical protein